MKIRNMAAVAVAAALSLTTACASAGSPSTTSTAPPPGQEKTSINLGLSFDHFNAVRQAELEGIESVTGPAGSTIVRQVANSDAETQASQIQTMIDVNKVDALVVIPVNFDQVAASIVYARSKNVPVIVIDHPIPDTSQIAYQVTGDPVADGRAAAEAMLATGRPEKVVELVGSLTDGNAIGRRDGFAAGLQGSEQVQIVQQIPTDWVAENALNGLTNALQSNPDITAVYTPSDFLLPAVQSALQAAGRWAPIGDPRHVTVVSIDGDENGCKLTQDGYVDAVIVTLVKEFGPKAVDAAMRAVNGLPIEPKVETIPGLPVTHQSIADQKDQVWGC